MSSQRFKRHKTDRPNDGSQGSRHPPHLKGKAIGLFYARRNKERASEDLARPIGTINLQPKWLEYCKSKIKQITNTPFLTAEEGKDNSYDQIKDSKFKRDFLQILNESIEQKLEKNFAHITADPDLDAALYQDYRNKQKDSRYQYMLRKRKSLPSYSMKDEILDLIDKNQIVVLSGETGCGKTTQVAQFILDDYIQRCKGSMCKIYCTQPRRISAISIAERVADERAEKLGQSVGFQIRLENSLPRNKAAILYCTTGIVLRIMESDPALTEVSHLILDEIHERNVMSDFIMALIKKISLIRKDLKIILMSATLNAEKFSKYFDDAPHINIPGFTFPVQEFYLEDVIDITNYDFGSAPKKYGKADNKELEYMENYLWPHVRNLEAQGKYSEFVCRQLRNSESENLNLDLIMALIMEICRKDKDNGAILVFLPGYSNISNLIKLLSNSGSFPPRKFDIYPLHSQMPSVEQKQIFEPPSEGVRKIIVATNIAETSITIDDVIFVIDSGRIKVSNYNSTIGSQTLATEWVSLANANQRKGRAGRVKPGVCYHLYSKAREMTLEQYQVPEILRTRLEDVILTAKVLQLGKIEQFFPLLIDVPNPDTVRVALNLLKELNALDEEESLTPLGYHLAKLPMAPQLGKMILFGAIFSCLDPILSIAATLDFKDPFQIPLGKEKEVDRKRHQLGGNLKSDHLLFWKVLNDFENSRSQSSFCWQNFLSFTTMRMLVEMKTQFTNYLYEMKFVENNDPHCPMSNVNSNNVSLLKAIICAGLYPNVLLVQRKKTLMTLDRTRVKPHLKSLLQNVYFDAKNVVYYHRLKSTSDFIHDGTLINPLPLVFFGNDFIQTRDELKNKNVIAIKKELLKYVCQKDSADVIQLLRNRFEWFLEYKISHPGPVNWQELDGETTILSVIMELITLEDIGDMDDYNSDPSCS